MPTSLRPRVAVYWKRIKTWLERGLALLSLPLHASREIPTPGDNTMVTKQDESFILKNLLALAAVEALGGAIALGFAFNLLT